MSQSSKRSKPSQTGTLPLFQDRQTDLSSPSVSPHAPGRLSGTTPGSDPSAAVCSAVVYRYHETFTCKFPAFHIDARGHRLIQAVHTSRQKFHGDCSECGGLVEHADDCSQEGRVIPPAGLARPVRWTGDGDGAILMTFATPPHPWED